jgi:hypothetical protein
MSRTRSPIPPHDASYLLTIEGPIDNRGCCDFFSSGPWTTWGEAAWKFTRVSVTMNDRFRDATVRITERGGECRTWTRNKHGEFVLDPIDRIEQTDPQLKLGDSIMLHIGEGGDA